MSAPHEVPTIHQAAAGRMRDAALALLYSRLPRVDREQQLAELRQAVRAHQIALDQLLVASRDGGLVGVVLAVERPGRMAFVWPPVVAAGEDALETGRRLLEALGAAFDDGNLLFAQCLVDLQSPLEREILVAGGFPYLTDMLLMTRSLPTRKLQRAEEGVAASQLEWINYAGDAEGRFARVLDQTCVGSLDCPSLIGRRSGLDALAAHRQTGRFDPALWQIVRQKGIDVGILLAADHLERNAREIAYLGVIPEARGHGLGRCLLEQALHKAAADGRDTLEIAVDLGNLYARRVYEAAGFREQHRLAVHLRWRSATADTSAAAN